MLGLVFLPSFKAQGGHGIRVARPRQSRPHIPKAPGASGAQVYPKSCSVAISAQIRLSEVYDDNAITVCCAATEVLFVACISTEVLLVVPAV